MGVSLAGMLCAAVVPAQAQPVQIARDDAARAAAAFRSLADDAADPEIWLAAAVEIGASGAAETLRTKTAPSLGELFARRIVAMPVYRTCQLATAFIAWDAAAALPHVADYMHGVIAGWSKLELKPVVGDCLAELTTVREYAGDATALADYATWIARTARTDSDDAVSWFAPMAQHPHAREIVRAAAIVFGRGSRWTPLAGSHLELLEVPGLLEVDAFRAHVIAALGDFRRIGTVTVSAQGSEIIAGNTQISQGIDPEDPPRATLGTSFAFRIADDYALTLVDDVRAPRFAIYWPVAARDHALARLAAWLTAWPPAK